MMQTQEMTHEEKVAMYSYCTKLQLIEMLIEANNAIAKLTPVIDATIKIKPSTYTRFVEKVKCTCRCHSDNHILHVKPCCDNGWKYVIK
jgi:phage tail protein X